MKSIRGYKFEKLARNKRHWIKLYDEQPEFIPEFRKFFIIQLTGVMLSAWAGMTAGILLMFSLWWTRTEIGLPEFQFAAIPGLVGFVIMALDSYYFTPRFRKKWGFEK